VIDVSAVTGEGIDRLRQHLFTAARAVTVRAADGRFRLSVDRSFTLRGTGTVVTGTVLSGRVALGDRVVVSPSGRDARVRSIHAQNRAANEGVAGQRCALNLAGEGIAKDEIARGDMVLDPSLHAPADRIDAVFRLLPLETKPLVLWTPVRLHHAAAEVAARIVPLSEDVVAPGAEGFVQLVLERPIPAAAGDCFVLRDTTAQRTLGGGAFVDLRAPGRKRRTPERLAQLHARALGAPADALAALLAQPPFYVDLAAFTRDRALASAQAGGMAAWLGLVTEVVAGSEFALAKPAWERFGASVTAALEAAHRDNPGLKGVGIERLRTRVLPLLPLPAFMAFLQRLAKGGSVVLDGAAVRLARHEASLAPDDEKLWAQILPLLSGAERFRPPRVVEIAAALSLREADVRRLLKSLAKMTKVDEIAPDHFFLRATVAEMADVVADLSAKGSNGQFSAAEFRDRLDNGRKVAIQILEFFDRHSVTVRRGDLRRLNEARRDLYRRGAGAPAAA
jgi:selenocysteine-specific elongation factor